MENAEHDAMARSRAEVLFNKQRAKHGEFHRAGEKEWREDAAKAARLRVLRLAKEREEPEKWRPRRAASRRISHTGPR
jgi:hypothetical protein